MRLEHVFMGLVVALAMFTGLMSIHQDMNERHGVENPETFSVQEQYEEMERTIKSDSNQTDGLYEKIKTISQPTEDIFATAAAGLTIVPQFVSLFTKPVEIAYAAYDSVVAAIPFLPNWVRSLPGLLVTVAVAFGALAAWLRWRV